MAAFIRKKFWLCIYLLLYIPPFQKTYPVRVVAFYFPERIAVLSYLYRNHDLLSHQSIITSVILVHFACEVLYHE